MPYSIDRSPYFQVKVPLCVIRNGEGRPIGRLPGRLLPVGEARA
jgi:hypothetical protein